MGKKIIRFGLSVRDIDKAMRELEQYKQDIIRKTDLLREKVAERLAELSRDGFAGAVVDDLLKGGQRTAQVDVSIDQRGNITLVIARGEDTARQVLLLTRKGQSWGSPSAATVRAWVRKMRGGSMRTVNYA